MDGTPGFRPLYRQVYDYLVARIVNGTWKAGEALPSEQALAAELGVSQGTVRKSLDVLALEKLIERRQGKGTFVAEHTQERALFRFFRLARPEGERVTPACGAEKVRRRPATRREIEKLELPVNSDIVQISRTRLIDGKPAVLETISVPELVFPDIEKYAPLPNALYSLYQTVYGVNIVHAVEQVRADLARKDDAKRLQLAAGAPILHIDRVAIGLDGRKVEWRVSRCNTTDLIYGVTIR